jgi:hypothetical protein
MLRHMSAAWQYETTAATKLVMLALADHANEAGECWPGIRRLAGITGLSERAVQMAMHWLIGQDLVIVVEQGRRAGRNRAPLTPLYRLAYGAIAPDGRANDAPPSRRGRANPAPPSADGREPAAPPTAHGGANGDADGRAIGGANGRAPGAPKAVSKPGRRSGNGTGYTRRPGEAINPAPRREPHPSDNETSIETKNETNDEDLATRTGARWPPAPPRMEPGERYVQTMLRRQRLEGMAGEQLAAYERAIRAEIDQPAPAGSTLT